MTVQEQVQYWFDSADHDLEAAEALFEKQRYDWCLFIGHLVLEKALKAVYARDCQTIPPKIHDLTRLAEATKLTLTTAQKDFLDKVNDFHIEARYPDEKFAFYQRCTHEFADENLTQIKERYKWLKSQLTFLPSSASTSAS